MRADGLTGYPPKSRDWRYALQTPKADASRRLRRDAAIPRPSPPTSGGMQPAEFRDYFMAQADKDQPMGILDHGGLVWLFDRSALAAARPGMNALG